MSRYPNSPDYFLVLDDSGPYHRTSQGFDVEWPAEHIAKRRAERLTELREQVAAGPDQNLRGAFGERVKPAFISANTTCHGEPCIVVPPRVGHDRELVCTVTGGTKTGRYVRDENGRIAENENGEATWRVDCGVIADDSDAATS